MLHNPAVCSNSWYEGFGKHEGATASRKSPECNRLPWAPNHEGMQAAAVLCSAGPPARPDWSVLRAWRFVHSRPGWTDASRLAPLLCSWCKHQHRLTGPKQRNRLSKCILLMAGLLLGLADVGFCCRWAVSEARASSCVSAWSCRGGHISAGRCSP